MKNIFTALALHGFRTYPIEINSRPDVVATSVTLDGLPKLVMALRSEGVTDVEIEEMRVKPGVGGG